MKKSSLIAATLCTVSAGWPLGLLAADAEADASVGLAEIVVTAQKRAEDLDKVPISISAFDRAQMDIQGVRDLSDIASITPGVDFRQRGSTTELSIRGISSQSGAATAGIYIDDVPVQVRTPTLNLVGSGAPKVFDLDRVEVLRGPQGTYFGAGAEGGAIRFITPQASLTDYTGYTRAGFSGTESGGLGYEAGIAVGGPIVNDELGFRISVWHERQAGYIDHYSTLAGGERAADSNWSDSDAAKLSLLFKPVDSVRITPSVFFQNIYAHDLSSFDPTLSNSSNGSFVNGGLLQTPEQDRIVLPSLKAEFDFGPVTLTSISAYLYRQDNYVFDYTNIVPAELGLPPPTSAVDFASVPYSNMQKNVSEELRLQSNDPNARLKWTLGSWFSIARQQVLQDVVEPDLSNFLLQNTGFTLEQIFGSGLLPGNYSYRANDTTHDRQIAGFGQIDYEIIDRLTLTAGVRVARQSNDFTLMFNGPVNGGQTVSRGSESENVTTPKYGISYQLTDRNLLYASAAKGNRMGGANSPFFPLPGCTEQLAAIGVSSSPGAYNSDSVWSYEIGSKNRLFSDRLQVEASIFHLDWSNMQQNINVPACASSFTANVGKATSKGFDLVVNAQATDHVKLGLALGYVNAKIAQTTGIPGGKTFVSEGDQIDADQSPWTVSGNVQYDFTVLDGQRAYVRVDDEFRSKNPGPFSFNDPNSASYKPGEPVNPSTNVVNLRLGTLVHGWDVSIFGSNLANSHPLLNVTPQTSLAPLGYAYTLQPRTIGLTSIYRW